MNPGDFAPDMSPYGGFIQEVRTIGFLHPHYVYPTGKINSEILHKLKLLLLSNAITDRERSICACYFCGTDKGEITTDINGQRYYLDLGYSEIWLPAGHTIYVAPRMIVHLVETHNYHPPQEFLDAVTTFDLGSDWKAELARLAIMSKYPLMGEYLEMGIRLNIWYQMKRYGIVTEYPRDEISSNYFYEKYPAAQEMLDKLNQYKQQFY